MSNTPLASYFMRKKYEDNLIKSTKVIFSTCSTIAKFRYDKAKFRIILMDEASLASDVSVISCLKDNTSKLLLLGDIYQRPPFQLLSFESRTHFHSARMSKRHYFDRSLLKRLILRNYNQFAWIKLDYQYRYHPYIMEIVQCFYPFRLYSGLSIKAFDYLSLKNMKFDTHIIKDERVNFIQYEVKDSYPNELRAQDADEDDEALINFSEIEGCYHLLLQIDNHFRHSYLTYSVLVYTPYKNQLFWLQQYLDKNFTNKQSKME